MKAGDLINIFDKAVSEKIWLCTGLVLDIDENSDLATVLWEGGHTSTFDITDPGNFCVVVND